MDAPPIRYARTRDGLDIAFSVIGGGPPLLLAWGFQELRLRWTSELFKKFFDRIAQTNLVVQFDPRGQGLSSRNLPETTDLDDFALDLLAIIEELGFQSVILLGLTRLAKVALKFALEHQDITQGLVLWNCDPGAPRHGAFGTGRRLALSNWDYLIETSARATFPQDEYEIQRRMKVEVMTPDDFLVTLDALDQEIPDEDLSILSVPCLVLATSSASWSFAAEEQSRRMARLIPKASLVIYEDVGGGLFSPKDEVPTGIDAIRDFARGLPSLAQARESGKSVLSKRERQVMLLVAAGKSNLDIAEELRISRNTVRRHVANILLKMGATNRTQAAMFARDHGIN